MNTLTIEEAKRLAANGHAVYEARYDGRIWNAGGMVEVGDVIGYYATEADARCACEEYEMRDFDSKHLYTSVEEVTSFED